MAVRDVRGDAGIDVAADLAPSSAPGTRARLSGWRRWALGLAAPALLLLVWSLASASGELSGRLLPPPGDVARSARDFFAGDKRPEIPGVTPFAGAAAYVSKPDIDGLLAAVTALLRDKGRAAAGEL